MVLDHGVFRSDPRSSKREETVAETTACQYAPSFDRNKSYSQGQLFSASIPSDVRYETHTIGFLGDGGGILNRNEREIQSLPCNYILYADKMTKDRC